MAKTRAKKRNKTIDGAAAPIEKRRRTKSIDEIDETTLSSVTSKPKLFKVESNRLLKENPSITEYRIDPFFDTNLPIPYISSSVQSKLAIRAVNLNDVKLLQSLIDDVDHVSSIHIKRDFTESLSAIHYAIQRDNIDLLRILLKDLQEPKDNRCALPDVTLFQQNVDETNEIISSSDGENLLIYAMNNNCSREIYDLLSTTFGCTSYKNVSLCIQAGHRKLAASIINDRPLNASAGFSQLHYQVLNFDEEDLFVDNASKVTRKTRGHSELTPIHCAAINPNPKYLKQLLSIASKDTVLDKDRRRPIHYAAACEGSKPLEYLLSRDVNFNEVDSYGNSPLHIAASCGRIKNIEVLLNTAKEKAESNNADDQLVYEKFGLASINRMNKSQNNPLHLAILNRHLACIKILTDYGAQIDQSTGTSTDKLTPLMLACQNGSLDIVDYLIGHGARVEARDNCKRTPLIHACQYGQSHIVSYLLRRGADANVCDSSKTTALHYACAYGWFFTMKLLVEAGANPNAIDANQMTCLTLAFCQGHYGICDYLLSNCRANINIQTNDGLTLIMIIVSRTISSKMVEQLERVALKYRADCTLVDVNGRNAFHYLASNQTTDRTSLIRLAEILFKQKCNPIQMDNKAQTPLINALQSKNYLLIEYFLNQIHVEFNTDICHDGKTFLHFFAIECANVELTQMLINTPVTDQLKAVAETYDSHGRTPFHYCLQKFDEFCRTMSFVSVLLRKSQYKSIVNMIRYFLEQIQCDPDQPTRTPEKPNIFYLLRVPQYIDLTEEQHPLINFLQKTKNMNVLHSETQHTALVEAIHFRQDQIIDILLQHSSCNVNSITTEQQQTPLMIACKLQYFSLIKSLLLNPTCDLLIYDKDRNQALHHFLSTSQRSNEYLEIFRLFIEKLKILDGNPLNSRGQFNRTPLHVAFYHNQNLTEVEKILIENQCDLFAQDDYGNLPLHYVFSSLSHHRYDPAQIAALFLRAMNYKSIDTKNNEGYTPLHLAVKRFSTVSIMLFLKHQANISIEILNECIAMDNLNLFLTFFTQTKVDFDLSQSYMNTEYSIIDMIIKRNWGNILALVIDELDRYHLTFIQIFTVAITNNRTDIIFYVLSLISNRTILHETNSHEQNLFHILANHSQNFTEQRTFLSYLHDQHVQWNISDKSGSYPLHYACIQQNIVFIEFLHNQYATEVDFNQTDGQNNTACGLLFCSLAKAKSFFKDTFRKLIQSNKDLNCLCTYDNNELVLNLLNQTNTRITPLINAIIHNNLSLVEFLFELGVDANFPDENQRTPLMYAVLTNNIDVVKLLLKSNVNINAIDPTGRTCIHYLVQPFPDTTYTFNIELLELLHQSGASLTQLDQNGLSPLDHSINIGCGHLYEKLFELINGQKCDSMPSIRKHFSINDPSKNLLDTPTDYYADAQQFIDEYISKHSTDSQHPLYPVDPLSDMKETGEVVLDNDKKEPYDVRLTITDIGCGPIGLYNFYRMQIIKHKSKTKLFLLFTRWGRIGSTESEHKLTPYSSFKQCRNEFCRIFFEKTGNHWDKLDQFENQPQQYTLIQLDERHYQRYVNVPIDFQQLQDKQQYLSSKLQSTTYENFFQVLLNREAIRTNLEKSQLDIEWMPVSQLKPAIIRRAREILAKLKETIEAKDKLQLIIQQSLSTETDQLTHFVETICKLTNEYYTLIPLQGYGYGSLPIIDNKTMVKSQEQKLNDILELEIAYKMLLATQANLSRISPFDYLYKSMNCQFEPLNREDADSDLILRYIRASEPKTHVEQIFKVARANDDERLFQRNLPNHYLLWHGTKICNLISIFTRGLLVAPICAKTTGTTLGRGIYTADTFTKSLKYCAGIKQGTSECCFMLLCEVALGNSEDVLNSRIGESAQLDVTQYQSRHAHGRQIPDPRYTITRNYGVNMPLGQLIDCTNSTHGQHKYPYNEYIVFDESQIAIRYLVQFRK